MDCYKKRADAPALSRVGQDWVSCLIVASASARAAARSASFTLACESNTDIDGSIHTWINGASSPPCARIHTQYRLGRAIASFRLIIFSNMFHLHKKQKNSDRGSGPRPVKPFFRRGFLPRHRGIPLVRFSSAERAGEGIIAACAMLARGGGAGGSNGPGVPVLESEFPFSKFPFGPLCCGLKL